MQFSISSFFIFVCLAIISTSNAYLSSKFAFPSITQSRLSRRQSLNIQLYAVSDEAKTKTKENKLGNKNDNEDEGYYEIEKKAILDRNHKIMNTDTSSTDNWGVYEGFDIDWELEKARRLIEGPAFAPLRMTLWQPPEIAQKKQPPGFVDNARIFLNNALQLVGLAESFDGAPLVQGKTMMSFSLPLSLPLSLSLSPVEAEL